MSQNLYITALSHCMHAPWKQCAADGESHAMGACAWGVLYRALVVYGS